MKKVVVAVLLLTMAWFATGCGPAAVETATETPAIQFIEPPGQTQTGETPAEQTSAGQTAPAQTTPPPEQPRPETLEEQMEKTIQATITMEDGGVIVVALYPDLAPQSVRNFVYLARDGFYDGLKFHRIMKGFMIQGGCPLGTGTGNPGYSITGEFEINGFSNDLSHKRGVLSMARQGDPAYDSAGSQFFIVHGDSAFLDGSYAAFGQVTEGLDIVDRLADTPSAPGSGAVASEDMPVIKSITIDDDIELPEPNRIR